MSNKKEKIVQRVSMSKADKVHLAMSKIHGTHAVAKNMVLDCEQELHGWRKDGFKGAWWQHYFSRGEKD